MFIRDPSRAPPPPRRQQSRVYLLVIIHGDINQQTRNNGERARDVLCATAFDSVKCRYHDVVHAVYARSYFLGPTRKSAKFSASFQFSATRSSRVLRREFFFTRRKTNAALFSFGLLATRIFHLFYIHRPLDTGR